MARTSDTHNAVADTDDRGLTRRVVLKREKVIVLPADVDPEVVKAAVDVLRKAHKAKDAGGFVEAWVVIGTGEGSKTKAIEAHAGKPGTPDAMIGAFKAPNASAWTGGCIYDAPPLPLVQRRDME